MIPFISGSFVFQDLDQDADDPFSKPQTYMFGEMRSYPIPHSFQFSILIPFFVTRAALSITKATDVLDHIYSLPHEEQSAALASIRAIEAKAMLQQEAQPGLLPLIEYLESRGLRMGLCTRNFE